MYNSHLTALFTFVTIVSSSHTVAAAPVDNLPTKMNSGEVVKFTIRDTANKRTQGSIVVKKNDGLINGRKQSHTFNIKSIKNNGLSYTAPLVESDRKIAVTYSISGGGGSSQETAITKIDILAAQKHTWKTTNPLNKKTTNISLDVTWTTNILPNGLKRFTYKFTPSNSVGLKEILLNLSKACKLDSAPRFMTSNPVKNNTGSAKFQFTANNKKYIWIFPTKVSFDCDTRADGAAFWTFTDRWGSNLKLKTYGPR